MNRSPRPHRSGRRSIARFDSLEQRLALSLAACPLPMDSQDSAHGPGCGCPGCGDAREILDASGLLYCELAPLEQAAGATGAADGVQAAFDPSQAFLLHSNPGATKRIYLDFDGHTTTGTSWNSSFTGGASIVTPAFDLDGNTASFSTAERDRIFAIWQRVAEDYFPFDVDVTTEDPGAAALSKSGTGDTEWGVRVNIGGSSTDWYGSAGGVAYVGSFSWSNDTPCFVFPAQLGGGNEKYTAEAISHEAGHTLGLSHDGRISPSEGYYQGHGSGATGWAPIMGVGYYKELTQWSRGEYLSANNTQDDTAIITTQNGFGYRADDAGNTVATASPAIVVGTSLSAVGNIERASDVDVFSFDTAGGDVSLTALPFERGANLDLLLELLNSSSTVIASANPTTGLSASLTAAVGSGVYYARLSGVGLGDPLSTGYTDYGSLGRYSLSGTIAPVNFDSVSLSASPASQAEGGSGSNASYTFTFNRGGDTSGTTTVTYAFNPGATDAADFGGTLPGGGQVVFGPGETAKTITITATGDSTIESDESFSMSITGVTGTTRINAASAAATIVNDDIATPPGITVSPTSGLTTTENRGTASFTVVLTTQPTATVTIPVASSDTTEGVVDRSTLTFTTSNWSVAQRVTITGVDDTLRDGNIAYRIVLGAAQSADTGYNGRDPVDVTVTNQDNEKRGKGNTKAALAAPGITEAPETRRSLPGRVEGNPWAARLIPVTFGSPLARFGTLAQPARGRARR